jgi:hypothetical protein
LEYHGYYINDTFNYRSVITYGNGYVVQGQAGHRNYGLDWHHYTNTAVIDPVEFCNDKDHYLPFLFLLLTHDFTGQNLGNSVYTDPFGGYKSNDGKFWLTDSVIQSYVDYHISDSIDAYGYQSNYVLISNNPPSRWFGPFPPATPAPAVINMTYDSYIAKRHVSRPPH